MKGWKRRTYVVGQADPTLVVVWSGHGLSITEFQAIYSVVENEHGEGVVINRMNHVASVLGKELHKALESEWDAEQERLEVEQEGCAPDGIYGDE